MLYLNFCQIFQFITVLFTLLPLVKSIYSSLKPKFYYIRLVQDYQSITLLQNYNFLKNNCYLSIIYLSLLVFYCWAQITTNLVAYNNTYLLLHGFSASRVWAKLSRTLCSGSPKTEIKVSAGLQPHLMLPVFFQGHSGFSRI